MSCWTMSFSRYLEILVQEITGWSRREFSCIVDSYLAYNYAGIEPILDKC